MVTDGSRTGQALDLTPKAVDFDVAGRAPDGSDIRLAQRAVVVHQAESWEHGDFCRNCHAPFPCRLARWGHRSLTHAGYTESAIANLIEQFRNTGPRAVRPAAPSDNGEASRA